MTFASRPAGQQETSAPKNHIIVVEDDPSNAEVLALLLQGEASYQVTCFRTGGETLANLDLITSLKPLLFMLDYQLPSMTALDLSEQLHLTQGLDKVPTIVLSGNWISDKEKERMMQKGLIVIQKPYDIDDLLATIEQMVG